MVPRCVRAMSRSCCDDGVASTSAIAVDDDVPTALLLLLMPATLMFSAPPPRKTEPREHGFEEYGPGVATSTTTQVKIGCLVGCT